MFFGIEWRRGRPVRHAAIPSCVVGGLLAIAAPLFAQVHFGSGSMPCNKYTTGATNRTLAYHEANEWLLGYASGLNAARPAASGADPLLTTNSANLLTFVEAYCKTNPEHSIIKGVDDWFKALSK